jgi:chromosome segregation ATPase
MNIALGAAIAVAVGGAGYLLGTSNSTPTASSVGEAARSQLPPAGEVVREEVATSSLVESPVILANGVGTILEDKGAGDDETRRAFLEASERRASPKGKGGRSPLPQEDTAFEEDSRTSDGDIAEISQRMEALEQAFALDSRRNRGRTSGGGGELKEVEELKETVANLYDIVGGLPSLDTLETKVAAVDGAIEEMNATMEKLVDLGGKLEALQKGGGEEAGKIAASVKELQSEVAKLSEIAVGAGREVEGLRGETAKNSETLRKNGESMGSLASQVSVVEASLGEMKTTADAAAQDMEEMKAAAEEAAKGTEETKAAVAKAREEAEASSAQVRAGAEGDRRRIDAMTSQLSVMDKNLRSAVEGYRKVYENAARNEKRFLEIEAFLGNIESRMGAVEANFGPAQ